jgi:hypothetical protein
MKNGMLYCTIIQQETTILSIVLVLHVLHNEGTFRGMINPLDLIIRLWMVSRTEL